MISNLGRMTTLPAAVIVIAGGFLACSHALERRAEVGSTPPSEPTPLTFADGTAPPGAGGGTYDEAGSIIFDVFPADRSPAKIHRSHYTAAGWTAPIPAITGFDHWHAGGSVSPDGSRLYFESTRRDPGQTGREDSDLWVADRRGKAWGNARPAGPPFDSPHNEHNVTISSRQTICINSNRPGVTAAHDILCARRSVNGWEAPRPLGAAVNSPSRDIAPFISPEERFLLFSSNRPGGAGEYDLYISVNRTGEWQPAINLGPGVNSAASESNPAVSRDGRRLLFSRSIGGRVTMYEVRFDPSWLRNESP
jgi:WD40-like Beta Propeller Repeat